MAALGEEISRTLSFHFAFASLNKRGRQNGRLLGIYVWFGPLAHPLPFFSNESQLLPKEIMAAAVAVLRAALRRGRPAAAALLHQRPNPSARSLPPPPPLGKASLTSRG